MATQGVEQIVVWRRVVARPVVAGIFAGVDSAVVVVVVKVVVAALVLSEARRLPTVVQFLVPSWVSVLFSLRLSRCT